MNIFCWRLFGVNYLDFVLIKNPRDIGDQSFTVYPDEDD